MKEKPKRSGTALAWAVLSLLIGMPSRREGATGDFISLTDIAKKFGDDALIYSWIRNRNTLDFIGIWEQIHNPAFKGIEFETFIIQAGLNRFSLTPRKWIEATGAIGFQSKAGRYGGGTYAHKDIAITQMRTLLNASSLKRLK